MRRNSILAVLVALALLVGGGAVVAPVALSQAARVDFNSWVFVTKLTVKDGGATIDAGGLTVTDGGVTVTDDGLTLTDDDLTVTSGNIGVTAGNLTLTDGNLTQSNGNVSVADHLAIAAQTAITVTNGATLSPSGSYQPIQAAGNVGFGAITAGAAGRELVIINVSNTTITITDTGTLKLSGNAALG